LRAAAQALTLELTRWHALTRGQRGNGSGQSWKRMVPHPIFESQEIHVWYWVTEDDEGLLESQQGVLSRDEQARRDRFVFAADRRDFAAAHVLVRLALSSYEARAPAEWRFTLSDRGKPHVSAEQAGTPPLRFSVSHTRGLVACALTRGADVGVDVERTAERERAGELAPHVLAPEELALARVPGQYARRFTELWTLKEAYVKAVGAGLSVALPSIAFELEDAKDIRFRPRGEPQPGWWRFALATCGDHYLAVAARVSEPARTTTVVVHRYGKAGSPLSPLRWSSDLRFTSDVLDTQL
jgi:4'-phosphopantetheinyl transferase